MTVLTHSSVEIWALGEAYPELIEHGKLFLKNILKMFDVNVDVRQNVKK